MTVMWETVADEGFKFFGKMSASLTHEIKNALAILNENAGLLEDLTLFAGQGRPIDPARLQTMAVKMKHQVQRADELVKRMNRFAHSADMAVQTVNIGDALELIVALARRPATLAEATLELKSLDQPVQFTMRFFSLQHLIWLAIDYLLTGKHKEIHLTPEVTQAGVEVRVAGQFPFPETGGRTFPSVIGSELLKVLQATLRIEPSAGELIFTFQKTG